jgi:hypothetical protein
MTIQGGVMETLPTDFSDLKPTELYRSAIEDFALPVEPEDKNKKRVLLAAFAEGGVEWNDYVAQHPEVKPEATAPVAPAPVEAPRPGEVIKAPERDLRNLSAEYAVSTEPTQKWADDERGRIENQRGVVTAPAVPVAAPGQDYLIKMDRENPLYEIRGYRFTKEHPYQLVRPEHAETILREPGFRVAYPSEAQEFYG